MFDLSLFRKPAFDGASIAAFVLSAAMFAMFLYLTLFVQNALGYSALEAGLRFLPVTLLSFAVAPLSGKFAERLGVRWFVGGGPRRSSASACCSCAGIGPRATTGRRCCPASSSAAWASGWSTRRSPPRRVGVVEPRRAGMASGINSTFRQVGIATGTAALGRDLPAHAVNGRREAFAQTAARRRDRRPARAGPFSDFISFGIFRRVGGGEAVARAGRDAFLHGLHVILLCGAVVAFAGALACGSCIRPRDFAPHGASAREPAAGEPAAV